MVYLDNAASAPPSAAALQAFATAAQEHYGNASSAHGLGAAAARALQAARADVLAFMRGDGGTVTFTSGGTEANALAVRGAARARKQQPHVVVSAIEHPAVLRNVEALQSEGWHVDVVPPRPDGVVNAEDVLSRVTPKTGLVALMLANNELGTLQPVDVVGRLCKELPRPPHVHVDAVAAAPFFAIDAQKLNVDSIAISGHKLAAPKGVGALWLRKGARLVPLWHGGGQEAGLRSGTENVAGAVALARACVDVRAGLADAAAKVAKLRDDFEAAVCASVSIATPTVATQTPRVPHICSVRLAGLPAEPLLHALETHGVFAAAGSACASKSKGPSHVLTAIGVHEHDAVLRFSLSRQTTQQDCERAHEALVAAIAHIANVTDARSARRSR
ncbi:MAG: cysteine desulfurase family protein [Deltaproteobacteria bacterium]|nr:cysteine desulfurase family protein [Deltaproteobacteria bacterium]